MEDNVFVKLYQEYHTYVYRYLFGLTRHAQTSEDLTQETFLRALSVLQTPGSSIKAWLLTVAHNLYVDHVRKMGRIDYHGPDTFPDPGGMDIGEVVSERDRRDHIFRMIHELPDHQKQALLLCIVNGLSQLEAAKILGTTEAGITNLIYRARKTLKARRSAHE